MESGYDNSPEQDTDTVTKENKEPTANPSMDLWWKEENLPRMKKYMERLRNPKVDVVCDEGYLELGEDPIPQSTVLIVLKSICNKPITYGNTFPLRKKVVLS